LGRVYTYSHAVDAMTSPTAKLANIRVAGRPTTGRRHSKEVLLLHRALQLDCCNEFGWDAREHGDVCDLASKAERQPEKQQEKPFLLEQLLEPQPEQAERQPEKQQEKPFLLEQLLEHQPEQAERQPEKQHEKPFLLEQLLEHQPEQEPKFNTSIFGPPPGLEACNVNDPSIRKDTFFQDDAIMAMTTDAMLASCDRENISSNSFSAGPVNQASPMNAQTTPKSSLHICLADCIDDTSTAASENSPALFPRDLIDGTGEPEKKVSPKTLPLLFDALNFAPGTPPVPSLAEALPLPSATTSLAEAFAFAPTTPKLSQKAKSPISLEAMLEFSPTDSNQSNGQEGALKKDTWNPSLVSPGMLPMGAMPPWWFSSFPEVRSPSNNTNGLLSKSVAGFPNATAFWPTGAWSHSMHAANIPGKPETLSRASGTTDTTEVFRV